MKTIGLSFLVPLTLLLPPVQSAVFQEGAGGYVGTKDTLIHPFSEASGSNAPTVIVSSFFTFVPPQGGGGSGPFHGLLRFDNIVGSGPNQIPAGSTITSVTLSLKSMLASYGSTNTVMVHRMIRSWQDTATWASMNNGISADDLDASAVADAQFLPTNSAPFTINLSNSGLTATVQAWVNGAAPNRGWAFLPTGTNDYRFSSSEDEAVTNRPSLRVDFIASNPPVIITNPQNQSVCLGGNATFSVTASSPSPLGYQWWFNITNIFGATNSSYTVVNAQLAHEGNYYVVVSNSSGSTTSAVALLTITEFEDFTPPEITCPQDMITNTTVNSCLTTKVFYTPSVVDNCDPNPTVFCLPPDGQAFPKGVHVITCYAVDAVTNFSQCTFTLTVLDLQPPAVTCPPNITTNASPGLCSQVVIYRAASTNDNCVVSNVVCNPPSGSSFFSGTTTVTCRVTDVSGNTNGCTFTVTVLDTSPPSLVCPDITVPSTSEAGAYVSYGESLYHPVGNCDSNGVSVLCAPPEGFFPVGITPVACTAWDSNGNSNRCTFQVSVIECRHSHKGQDFWLTFPANFPDPINPQQLSLAILGPSETTGTVEIEVPHFSTTFAIAPGSMSATVILPPEAELAFANDAIMTNGIHVTASQPVAVYALNHIPYSTDGYLALPTKVLGTRYIVLGYSNVHNYAPDLNGTQFAIVSSADNTTVDIKPSVTTGSRNAGTWFSIHLDRGQTYQLRNTNGSPNDLTGTIIESDKPIAVFGGHQAAAVPDQSVWFWDHLVEQLLPVSLWGTVFYAQPMATRLNGDRLRILAANADTLVSVSDGVTTLPFTLHEGQSREMVLTKASRISANKKILLAQYSASSDFDDVEIGDPTMILVPSIDHFRTDYMIWTPTNGFTNHFLSVLGFAPTIDIDDTSISLTPSWISGIYTGTVAVAPGAHSLFASQPFGVIAYGFAELNAYGYPGGFALGEPVSPILVCPSNITTTCNRPSGAVVHFTPTVLDNCDPYPSVVCLPPSGSIFPFGTTTVNCTAADASENIARCGFTVTVSEPFLRVWLSTFDAVTAVIIDWDGNGTLQQTDQLGTDASDTIWVDATGQPRPYRVVPAAAQRFYRVSACEN